MRYVVLLILFATFQSFAQVRADTLPSPCGELVTVQTHNGTTTVYSLAQSQIGMQQESIVLVLLVGEEGVLDLDEKGCPRKLQGNSLVRSLPIFQRAGFATALVDAPSDQKSSEGLAGFRLSPQHAEDIGKIISDIRVRTKRSVWLVGTSRGTLSAANAAARLSGVAAPDGLVLTSALTSGGDSNRKPWVTQTVFDLPLEAIKLPVLIVGHAEDKCIRTPPALMNEIIARTNGIRERVEVVEGGATNAGNLATAADCEGRSAHGFIGQEEEAVHLIEKFVRAP